MANDFQIQNTFVEKSKTTVHPSSQLDGSKIFFDESGFSSSGSGIEFKNSVDSFESKVSSGEVFTKTKNNFYLKSTDSEETSGSNLKKQINRKNINGNSLIIKKSSIGGDKSLRHYIKQSKGKCENGEASFSRRCVCDVGYSGESCEIR